MTARYNRLMTLDEIEAEAKKLDPTSRAALISRLSASLAASHGAPGNSAPGSPAAPAPQTEEQKEREWLQEALRRSRELRERQIQTEPPDRRPSPASAAPTMPETRPASVPLQGAATAGPKPRSKPVPKKRKTAPTKSTKSPRRPTPRRPARPVAKRRAASKPKPKPKPKTKPKPSKSQARKKR